MYQLTPHSPAHKESLKVIGAGFGRTGTMSLKVALEELGFGPCYHMIEVFENPEHVEFWEAAARGEPVDWEVVFRGYEATVDWPGAAFYKELMENYPEARVILTVRDAGSWYESALNTIYGMRRIASSPMISLTSLFVPRIRRLRRVALMAGDLVWEKVFDGEFENRERAIEIFYRWNEEVKETVPEENLLVYEVKEGWVPLCEFLGVGTPVEKPFPHLNDTQAFRKMVRRRVAATFAVISFLLLALLYLLARGRFSNRLLPG